MIKISSLAELGDILNLSELTEETPIVVEKDTKKEIWLAIEQICLETYQRRIDCIKKKFLEWMKEKGIEEFPILEMMTGDSKGVDKVDFIEELKEDVFFCAMFLDGKLTFGVILDRTQRLVKDTRKAVKALTGYTLEVKATEVVVVKDMLEFFNKTRGCEFLFKTIKTQVAFDGKNVAYVYVK